MYKLLLVDDQVLIRQGLRYILEGTNRFEVVGEANTGLEALTLARRTCPDLILMDIRMPEMDGIQATRAITDELPGTKVILITTFDDEASVVAGIRAGAVGYVLKDIDADELAERLERAMRGEIFYLSPHAQAALQKVSSLSPESDAEKFGQQHLVDALTERELDVLQRMAYGHRNSEIAKELHVSEGTVKTHVHRILQKLMVEDRTQAVVLALRSGLVK